MNPILLPVAAKVERRRGGREEEEKALAAAAKKEEGIGSLKRRSEGERLGVEEKPSFTFLRRS